MENAWTKTERLLNDMFRNGQFSKIYTKLQYPQDLVREMMTDVITEVTTKRNYLPLSDSILANAREFFQKRIQKKQQSMFSRENLERQTKAKLLATEEGKSHHVVDTHFADSLKQKDDHLLKELQAYLTTIHKGLKKPFKFITGDRGYQGHAFQKFQSAGLVKPDERGAFVVKDPEKLRDLLMDRGKYFYPAEDRAQ